MPKTIYSCLNYAGPRGESPAEYKRILEAMLSFPTVYQLCFTDLDEKGNFDRGQVQECLAGLPPNTRVMIDREGGLEWSVFDWAKLPAVQTEAIQRRVDLAKWLKSLRPDCEFGFFGYTPTSLWQIELFYSTARYGLDLNVPPIAVLEMIDCQQEPIVAAVDYLMPQFYLPSHIWERPFTTADLHTWAGRVFDRCRRYWPGKPVMPIIWPDWYPDVWEKYAAQTPGVNAKEFVWTPEIIQEIRVPGEFFQALTEEMDRYGMTDVLVWQEGWQPWDDSADWLTALLRWRGTFPRAVSVAQKISVEWR